MYTIEKEIFLGIVTSFFVWLVYKLLKKLNIKIDRKLLYLGISIAFLGASARLFEDAGILPYSFWTVTPGIWFIFLGIFFLETVYLIKSKNYKFLYILNLFLSLFLLFIVYQHSGIFNFLPFFLLIPLVPLYLLRKDRELFLLLFFSGLDSIVPVFSTNFLPYIEQHPIPRFLLSTHPILYPTVRLFFSYFVYLILNKNNDFERFILYILIVISAGTSLRSFFRTILMV